MLKTVTQTILAAVVSLGAVSLILSTAQAVEIIPSLELRVNRLNGVTRIITTGTPATSPDTNGLANLASYTIADISGASLDVWVPGNWTSITSQELPGSGWEEVPPEAPLTQSQVLSELNLTGSKAFAFGDIVPLGNIYDTAILDEAVSFTYGLAGNTTPFMGSVVFEGLVLNSPLELHVNRFTGQTRILGTDSTDPADITLPADLASYTIASNSANSPLENVWIPSNWTSITSQELPGSGWEEVPPTGPTTQNQSLSELNLTGSKTIAPGDVVSLGTLYDVTDIDKDITFVYGLAGNANPIVGSVVFDGVGLRLRVNKLTGKVEIVNDETAGIDFDAYMIQSDSGDLNFSTWSSLEDQAVSGWGETNSTSTGIAESNLLSSSILAGGSTFDLGTAYQGGLGGIEDLSFEYGLTGGEIVSGVIEYFTPSPGDFDMNGEVNGLDFLTWQRDLGDAPNLALWEANFGTAAALSAAITTVPEPGTASLILIGLAGLVMFSPRRKR